MRQGRWESTIRVYTARDVLTLDVSHNTQITREVEIEALGARMREGDQNVAYFELIWHIEPFTTTRYDRAEDALRDVRAHAQRHYAEHSGMGRD